MIVGSIVSFGSGFGSTAVGGVNCLSAGLGSRPFEAGNGERSPPPPPPAIVFFAWRAASAHRRRAFGSRYRNEMGHALSAPFWWTRA